VEEGAQCEEGEAGTGAGDVSAPNGHGVTTGTRTDLLQSKRKRGHMSSMFRPNFAQPLAAHSNSVKFVLYCPGRDSTFHFENE
jgi:hypothetical protein